MSGLFFITSFFVDISGLLLWPRKQFRLFFNFDFNFGISQGTFKYCWISGVRRVLKLIVCPLSWLLSEKVRLRFRSRFLFLFLSGPEAGWRWGLGAPGSDSWGLLPTDGELVCSWKRKDDEYGRCTLKILLKS